MITWVSSGACVASSEWITWVLKQEKDVPVQVVACDFEGNEADDNRGAVFSSGADLRVETTKYTQNEAKKKRRSCLHSGNGVTQEQHNHCSLAQSTLVLAWCRTGPRSKSTYSTGMRNQNDMWAGMSQLSSCGRAGGFPDHQSDRKDVCAAGEGSSQPPLIYLAVRTEKYLFDMVSLRC